ncbi:hypothetical protein TNCV_952831 [Trichonephila clavipes]|nr:hypothetical protein TNCV_952831 [Trichonephila clavipes]
MGHLTYAEKANMQYIYDRANGNGRPVLRMYHAQFPDQRMSDHRIFQLLHLCMIYLESSNVYANRSTDVFKQVSLLEDAISNSYCSHYTCQRRFQ